jgi:hypothetical protein
VVTKQASLDEHSKLKLTPIAQVIEASCRAIQFEDLSALAHELTSRAHNECHIYGLPQGNYSGDVFEITTKERLIGSQFSGRRISRSKESFSWPQGSGVLMLDYDAPKDGTDPLSKDDLIHALFTAIPELAQHQILWTPSTSSCIHKGTEELRGIKGQRLYILVSNASKIPEVGAMINERLWATGFGRHEVSKSGQILERPLFDASVWQTNHIDFCAGAACKDGLTQNRGEPQLLGGDKPIWEVGKALAVGPGIRVRAGKNKRLSRAQVAELARSTKEAWIAATGKRYSALLRDFDPLGIESIVHRAIEHAELACHWRVCVIEHGLQVELAVHEILSNPERYDGAHTLDPIEPDYDGGRPVGKLFLSGARPNLYSFAHGGANYRLIGEANPIEITEGKEAQVVDAALEVLRRSPDLYDFGDALVEVCPDSRLYPLRESALKYTLGKHVQFKCNGKLRNPPPAVCKTILEVRRDLKPLRAVISAPTLRLDGSVLNQSGYDPASELFLATKEVVDIPFAPTEDQALQALNTLMDPFKDFPFIDNLAWSVHLAALLTAAIRPSVQTAPAFVYDAPTQGSGKSLLASCVAMIGTGRNASIWPHVSTQNADEIRKRMFTALKEGERILVWDNVIGAFDSAPLAAILTSPSVKDRLLNTQSLMEVPNRALLLLTGNNFTPAGDMARRVFICRIDPRTETPFTRQFAENPLEICTYNRQQMVAAALTLARFYLASNTPRCGDTGSFSEWDLFVRQPIIYLGKTIAKNRCVDIAQSIEQNTQQDPEAELMLTLYTNWFEIFGSDWKSAKEIVYPPSTLDFSNDDKRASFVEGLRELTKNQITVPAVSRALGYRKGRVVGGLVLQEARCTRQNIKTWRVIETQAPGKPEKPG